MILLETNVVSAVMLQRPPPGVATRNVSHLSNTTISVTPLFQ
ncbi:MAG: hypothetical protein NWQ25_11260 [Prochlorococcaceae cyanobacterium MAG_34]|nr:hypothetical protein [Prochlorococcaceae cyanobacterium MAG_34]